MERVVSEDCRSAADRVDQLVRDLCAHRRTSPAPAETAQDFDGFLADVIRAVKNDRALFRHVVETFIETAKLQRVAVVADVCLTSDEKAEAAGFASRLVREESRDV